jgi:hypothetical protein
MTAARPGSSGDGETKGLVGATTPASLPIPARKQPVDRWATALTRRIIAWVAVRGELHDRDRGASRRLDLGTPSSCGVPDTLDRVVREQRRNVDDRLAVRPLPRSGRDPPFETDHDHVDYAAIAAGAGFHTRRVTDPADLRNAVAELLAYDGPALLDVVTTPDALEVPSHITVEEARGFALSLGKTVLDGGVGRIYELARQNLRNIPR